MKNDTESGEADKPPDTNTMTSGTDRTGITGRTGCGHPGGAGWP